MTDIESAANRTTEKKTLPVAIELRGISKSFGSVHANQDIDLCVHKSAIHGIIGENGAGKSTLMSIIYGFYEADRGEILVNGQSVRLHNSQDAIAAGIGMVHQHFMLVDTFTVLENVILGAESGGLLNQSLNHAREELTRLEREYNLKVDLDALVSDLPVGEQQRVEILKALYRGAEILILDEPTGVLTPQETDQLFEILKTLKTQGVTVLLITHKLREIMDITDEVSVMRGGRMVAHRLTQETDKETLAELMVGRKVRLELNQKPATPGNVLLKAENLTVVDDKGVTRVKGFNMELKAGEIIGIAGVSGNGQSELLQALACIQPLSQGSLQIHQHSVTPESPCNPAKARELGLGHIPEDRHQLGMVTRFSAAESSILGFHRNESINGSLLMHNSKVEKHCEALMEQFDVRPPHPQLKSANFSGGNQQKLIIAREMTQNPRILLVGQPTRGVDIGAIEFIHRQLIEMRDQGCAVLVVSVELDEIMSLSDRILVMCEGSLVGEVAGKDADERTLGLMMAGTPLDKARSGSGPGSPQQKTINERPAHQILSPETSG
ncbi:heme ABC transporter ATP-binding protein [Motiliproteus sp. MSK22-1]|nr:ABC transporter ATP-binding protein [Motiliproteus sp. MSK22-1]OMH32179.1 heme ABC transporter ATP-binding protein [Motiliproteus sp. MSK22-1]